MPVCSDHRDIQSILSFAKTGVSIIEFHATRHCFTRHTHSLKEKTRRNSQPIRSKLADVRLAVLGDRYLRDIPSIQKSLRAFHAKDGWPEVRKVFSALGKIEDVAEILGNRAEIVRKHYA